jgi:hypothetical protein
MIFDVEAAFREMAHGDEAALKFMISFYCWAHSLDDLIDRDKPVDLDKVHEAHFFLLASLATNEFFLQHRLEFVPVLLTSTLAHLESERFRLRDSVLDKIGSQILKSQYQDVFFYSAFLTGGFAHMLAMSKKYRDYDYDPVPSS